MATQHHDHDDPSVHGATDDGRPHHNRSSHHNDNGRALHIRGSHHNDNGADNDNHHRSTNVRAAHHIWPHHDRRSDDDRCSHDHDDCSDHHSGADHNHHRTYDDDNGLRPARRMRRHERERGAVLVETAISIPVFFLLIFAIIEFGFVFRDYTTVNAASTEAARSLAITGDDLDADYQTLQAIKTAAVALPDGTIQTIVIYAATGPSDPVPTQCLTASVDDLCNVYTGADLDRAEADFGCADASAPDSSYCPLVRDTSQSSAAFVGIHIVADRELMTGFFGDRRTLRSTDVVRVEPRDR